MKVQKLTLKEIEVLEVDGEFETRFINSKTYPIFLTNASIQKGYQLGYLETSLISSLVKLMPIAESENKEEMLEHLNELKMIQVVYLAFVGANRKTGMSFDDFIELYHLDFTETTTLFMNLIADSISNGNNFSKSFEQVTKSQKKNSSPQN